MYPGHIRVSNMNWYKQFKTMNYIQKRDFRVRMKNLKRAILESVFFHAAVAGVFLYVVLYCWEQIPG